MQWYKILARTLLMLSVINFALTAPVAIQASAKDGTATSSLQQDPSNKWPAKVADRTNAPPIPRSSDSGNWRKQEARQHNPTSRTDSIGSPKLSLNPVPPIDEPDLLNPSSPRVNIDLNLPPYQDRGPTDNSHGLNPALPPESSPLRPGPSHDDLDFLSASTHDAPPDGSPQIAPSPNESHSSSSWASTYTHSGQTDEWSPYRYVSPSSSWAATYTHSGQTEEWSPHRYVSPSNSWAATDTHSGQTKEWSPYRYVSPVSSPGQPQDHVPTPPNLGDHLPLDSHLPSGESTAGNHLGSPDTLSTAEYYLGSPDQSLTVESVLRTPGPTGNHPPPTSSSNPGPSTEPNPPPSANQPPPEEHEPGSFLNKITKGKLFWLRAVH